MEKKSEAAESLSSLKTSSGLFKIGVVSTRHSRKIRKLNTGEGTNDEDNDESLTDIADAELCLYLNNKKEARYKRMIWEAMNMDHQKGSNQKPVRRAIKDETAKKVGKPLRKMVNEKGLSSKINYDILNKLMHDGVLEVDNVEDMDSHRSHHAETKLSNDKSNSKAYSSGNVNDSDNEIEHESTDDEDAYSTPDHSKIADSADDDGHFYDEEDDYSEY